MRTTLTLDDDLATRLHAKARRDGVSFKAVVNGTLRRGILRGEMPTSRQARFVVEAEARGFRAGIDPKRLNQLLDDLEIEEFNLDHAERVARR